MQMNYLNSIGSMQMRYIRYLMITWNMDVAVDVFKREVNENVDIR